MSYLARLYDFTPNTLIQSSQVDDEFNQLVALLNGTSSAGVDVTFKGELRTTQNLLVAPVARTGAPSPFVRFQTPTDTSLTADTESTGMVFGGTSGSLTNTRTFTAGGGAFGTQREVRFVAPTYAFNSADTITNAIHVEVDTPRAGTNATLTNSYALKLVLNANAHQGLWIDNSQAAPTGNLLAAGIAGTHIFRIVPNNGDLNYVFCDSALGTGNTDGFIYYPSMAGTPAGTPTSYTGVVPTVIDSTNSLFYGYIGGSWRSLGGTSINSTNNVVPYRSSATAFADSSLTVGTNLALSSAITARSSGAPTFYFRLIAPADTGLTASTESVGIQLGGNTSAATVTRQWSTGALTTQREILVVAPTYSFVGASTLSLAATMAITGNPIAGSNATITNGAALYVASGKIAVGVTGGTWGDNTAVVVGQPNQGPGILVASSATPTVLGPTNNYSIQLQPSGTGLIVIGGSGVNEIWKDSTPTKAVSFGMAVPGVGITDDLIFARFDGSTWAEILRVANSDGKLTASHLTVSGKTFSIPKYLTKDSTVYATGANTTETDLASYTYAAGTFATNNDFSAFVGHGLTAVNANTKRIRGYVGGTLVLDTGAIAYAGGWEAQLKIIRLSATTVRVETRFLSGTNAGTIDNNSVNLNTQTPVTVSNLDSNTLLVKFTGQNGSATANDISQNWLDVAMINF